MYILVAILRIFLAIRWIEIVSKLSAVLEYSVWKWSLSEIPVLYLICQNGTLCNRWWRNALFIELKTEFHSKFSFSFSGISNKMLTGDFWQTKFQIPMLNLQKEKLCVYLFACCVEYIYFFTLSKKVSIIKKYGSIFV